MQKIREVLNIATMSIIYSLIVILINGIIIFIFTQDTVQILYWLSFITLIEGGLGLVVGGGTTIYSPILTKISEKLLNSEAWNYKKQKRVEQQSIKWIIVGTFLIIEALIISAI